MKKKTMRIHLIAAPIAMFLACIAAGKDSAKENPFLPAGDFGNRLSSESRMNTGREQLAEKQQIQSSVPGQGISESSFPMQGLLEADVSEQSVDGTGTRDATGNADYFDLYDHPELQKTTDKYVVNTESRIFHLPQCSDVAKMAYENYATSVAEPRQ